MMNDHDYIKERIENSGVNAPEHMDESYVLSAIADSKPKVIPFTKRRGARIAAIAASFVLVAGIAAGVAINLHNRSAGIIDLPDASPDTGLVRFTDRAQVLSALKKINEHNERYRTVSSAAVFDEAEYAGVMAEDANGSTAQSSGAKSASGGSAESHSETYEQVDGVREPDIIKTDGRYIYAVEYSYSESDYTDTSCVCIFPAVPGTTSPVCRIVPGEGGESAEATPDEGYEYYYRNTYISDLFILDGRLIIICGDSTDWEQDGQYYYERYTRAYVYDVSDVDNISMLDIFTQSGNYTSSRMIGDTLYLITNEYSAEDIPVCGRGATPSELEASCIYSVEQPAQSTFLIVSAYDTLDHTADTDSKAVLGVADDIYCSEDNLYITAGEYGGVWLYGAAEIDYAVDDSEPAASSAYAPSNEQKTKIFKVSLTDGIAFTAYCEVEGYVNSQYSLDEFSGGLRVATTSMNDEYEDVNNLFILNDELDQIGYVTGFAESESIKAVRYVGDTAYVITYEQTDPLFVIDLSDPTAPEILGEVKISGFSTMLVPIDENTVLGIGYNTGEADYTDMEVTDGLKLALFDVSDKSDPKVLDSRSYVNYSSPVMYNPRSLVYNPDRGDFVIPMNYYYYDSPHDDDTDYSDSWTDEDWAYYWEKNTVQYGAVLNFGVENGKIVETGLYRSAQDIIDRCVYVGDTVYMTYAVDNGQLFLDSVSYN